MAKDIKLKLSVDSKSGVANIKKIEKATKRFSEKTTKGVNDVTKAFDKSSKSVKAFGTISKKSLALITVGLVGAVYGAVQLSKSFLNAATTSEGFRVRLNTLLGSVEEGSRAFQEMSKFAGEVPYKYEEIMAATTTLAGVMRGGIDEIRRWMPLITDLAAVSGMTLQETTGQIVRMYSAGAASADMFRERGILAMMGFQAGVAYTAEETKRMMFESWEKQGSKFKGVTKDLAKTWEGIMSMIGDKWFQLRNIIMEAGVYDALKEGLEELNIALGEWIEKNKELIKIKTKEWLLDVRDAAKFLRKNIDLLVIGIKALTYATAAFIGLSFIKFLIPIVGWVIKWGAGATILAVQIKSLGAYYMVAHGAIIKWMASLGIATGMAATFGTVVLTLTGYLTALAVAYYAIVKLGKERLARWFGIPMEDAKKFREELDGIHKTQIKIAKESSKAYGYTGTWTTPSGYTPKMEERPAWLKKQLKEIEELRAHTTMLEELEEKIAKQRLERMVHDTNAEIDLIIKKHEIYKAELKKSEEKKLQLKKDFNEAYAAIGKTQLQLDIEAAEAQAEIWRGAGFNRIEIKEWETAKITKLEKAAADKTEDLNAKLLGGIKSWAMNFSNTLNEMLWGAEVTFANIAKSFAKMITQMLIQESMLKLIGKAGVGGKAGSGILGALFPSEKGNVINNGAMMTYAKGGIVNSPTLFPMANGAGLMGEAGPEAILPLQRGKGGVLGVSGGGGTTINTEINISMDNSTTNPEDTKRAGRDIARAVEYEFNRNLVKNLRPGGILNQGV